MTPYKVRVAALDEARGILGIRRDVVVRHALKMRSARTFQVCGTYNGLDVFHGFHQVTLKAGLDLELAHAMLVHELVHAAQCEREGTHFRFVSEYARQLEEAGVNPHARRRTAKWYKLYQNIPFEREAYYNQARAAEFDLLLSS